MKISAQLIRARSKESSLQSIQVLDLSQLDIYAIEKLGSCAKLQVLNLSSNNIESVSNNITSCTQLWSINLANNKTRCLDGLSRFVALGFLDLSNNNLSWTELSKIQHLHILDLRLYGNPELERDPYYRIHVIDCLPHVWMLDGRLITSAERIQVKSFFDDSAVSDRPIRHKLMTKTFVPTAQKTRDINGVFGDKSVHLMRHFPKMETHNISLDKRRLEYLCKHVMFDISPVTTSRQRRQTKVSSLGVGYMAELLNARNEDVQRSNMLLILLLSSLHFSIPEKLLMDTLELMRLDKFGPFRSMDLFLVHKDRKIFAVCILLSAMKVARIENKGGELYDKLYLGMNYLLTESTKSLSGHAPVANATYKQYRGLLAAEVVQLMCYVPSFSDYVVKEPGIMSLTLSATNEGHVIDDVNTLVGNLKVEKAPSADVVRAVGQYIQALVISNRARLCGKTSSSAPAEERVFTRRALPRRPTSGPIRASHYLTRGQTSPDIAPPRVSSAKVSRHKLPVVGDNVLTSPQSMAKIVSVPEPKIALVLLDMIPVQGAMSSKAETVEQHYAYIDIDDIEYDPGTHYWRPKGTVGSRVSLHYIGPSQESDQHVNTRSGNTREIAVTIPAVTRAPSASIVSNSVVDELITLVPRSHTPTMSVCGQQPDAQHSDPQQPDPQHSDPQQPDPQHSDPQQPDSQHSELEKPESQYFNLQKPDSQHSDPQQPDPQHTDPQQPDPQQPDLQHSELKKPELQHSNLQKPESQHSSLQKPDSQYSELEKPELQHSNLQKSDSQHTNSQQPGEVGGMRRTSTPGTEADNITNSGRTVPFINKDDGLALSLSASAVNITPRPPSRLSLSQTLPDGESAETKQDTADQVSSIEPEQEPRNIGDVDTGECNNSLIADDEDLELSALQYETDVIIDYERSIAPQNSPDAKSYISGMNSVTTSRQPSAKTPRRQRVFRNEHSMSAHPRMYYTTTPDLYSSDLDPYNTSYMKQRAHEWDLKIQDPDGTPGVSVKWANIWLAGGRDLHIEELKRRPKSAHVPGWKDTREGNSAQPRPHSSKHHASFRRNSSFIRSDLDRSSLSSQNTYEKQLSLQQRKTTHSRALGYRSSFLSTKRNMRDKSQLEQKHREMLWDDYINKVILDV